MARISYRRLASAMVGLMAEHSMEEVAQAAISAVGEQHLKLERLIPELERELSRQNGHIVIHAATARVLPQDLLERMANELTNRIGGSTYELVTVVQPDLLGGVRLSTADHSLDLTLRNRLETIRT